MTHILTLSRLGLTRSFAMTLHALRERRRMSADARHLDALPRDRLDDMGIAPRTEANRRHSGQPARMPRPPIW